MNSTHRLQPTLWRTCRVLANRTRLEMLRLMYKERGLCVSTVAQLLDLSITQASQYLRALEARGLLRVSRRSRWVYYEAPPAASGGAAGLLVEALRTSFQDTKTSTENIFKFATAFTHPRRIEIFRALQQPRRFQELQKETRLPTRALERHLRKLQKRDFVIRKTDAYLGISQNEESVVQRALAQMALAENHNEAL